MNRFIAVVLAILMLGAGPASQPATTATASAPSASPFTFVDVFIDSHDIPLAAYQFELRTTDGEAKLVGLEGGEHAAFAKPPYYDAKALMNDRVVVAAFNTASVENLPAGKTRVARLMVHVGGGGEPPKYHVTLQVAASSDGKRISDAVISVSEGVAQ